MNVDYPSLRSLPSEIICHIIKFITQNACKYENNISQINKEIHGHFSKCSKISYTPLNFKKPHCSLRPLVTCIHHCNEQLKEAIEKLNSLKYYHSQNIGKFSLHFSSEYLCRNLIKYASEYGIVSNLCCNNTGFVFISPDEMFNTFI